MNNKIISDTEAWVMAQLKHESSGHDWEHIRRVTRQAQEIAEIEGGNMLIVTLASLLHDLIDDKVVADENEGIQQVTNWLKKMDIDESELQHILTIIKTISYKGGGQKPVESLEAQIVQDADRLDALGAIGVARTFMYAGNKGHQMYNPEFAHRETMTVDEYRKIPSSAVGHFYEKLLKLKDLMNTKEAKKRAEKRHHFLEEFLQQFFHEWGERP